MKSKELQKDDFIDPAFGANVSFHSIKWSKNGSASTIPTGGNLNFHLIPQEGTNLHSHEFAEIILVLSGQIQHHINDECRSLSAGSLVFIRPSDQHYFAPLEQTPCEMIIFAFQLELLLSLSEYVENDDFMWKFTEAVMPPEFSLTKSETDEMGNQLLALNSPSLSGPPVMVKVRIKLLLAELFGKFFLQESFFSPEENIPEWLDSLHRKMQQPENFIKGLKKMQKMANCTPEHLCKSFRKYFNKTPTEYINELRIHHAARLLADTDDEIFSIALDLNFQSLSRFYHLFRKHYGMSPARFRKRAHIRNKIL